MESVGVSIVPSYDYKCDECGYTVTNHHSINYEGGYVCPECNFPMRKLISAPVAHFKGGGWGGSYPKRTYKTTTHADVGTGEIGSQRTEEI
jgi:putative FmdB family regulatory protein